MKFIFLLAAALVKGFGCLYRGLVAVEPPKSRLIFLEIVCYFEFFNKTRPKERVREDEKQTHLSWDDKVDICKQGQLSGLTRVSVRPFLRCNMEKI